MRDNQLDVMPLALRHSLHAIVCARNPSFMILYYLIDSMPQKGKRGFFAALIIAEIKSHLDL